MLLNNWELLFSSNKTHIAPCRFSSDIGRSGSTNVNIGMKWRCILSNIIRYLIINISLSMKNRLELESASLIKYWHKSFSQSNSQVRAVTVTSQIRHLITTNYSAYFEQCSPLVCSYSYMQHFDLIYIITFLLGFQGVLTIVLGWICPKIIQLIIRIRTYLNKRSNNVRPEQTVATISTNVNNTRLWRSCFSKSISICMLIMILIVALVIFSIYTVQKENNQIIQTTINFFFFLNNLISIENFISFFDN